MNHLFFWGAILLWTAFVAFIAWQAGSSAGYAKAMGLGNLKLRMRESKEAEHWAHEDLERSQRANALAREFFSEEKRQATTQN